MSLWLARLWCDHYQVETSPVCPEGTSYNIKAHIVSTPLAVSAVCMAEGQLPL
jgi:hypothetical protein